MRTTIILLVLLAAFGAMLADKALAGPSDEEKIAKIVRKYAYSGPSVFDDKFKPKAICHCHDAGRRAQAGILLTTTGLNLLCALPVSIADGELAVVDFGCQDFDIIGK